ncbi:NAD-binding protein [Citricoccus sp. NR2]|uniref:NAD-binding protein n=1 Tax=Citricoccus sp. NR2 TaxID=3004095 RepID=UPI0022DDCE8E|nr:NAD-binding protein [Citricoccus sp. NR2]WBL18066.1 NAD-binding protein [Citricoccus sp. NR2]
MRQLFWNLSDRLSGALMLVLLAGVYLLGLVGLAWYADLHDLDFTWGTLLYTAASLFLLENGTLEGEIPWPLEIARWSAPPLLALAALGTILTLVRERSWSLGALRARRHIVIVGLTSRGWSATRAAHSEGRRVVVIDDDAANEHVRTARRHGIPVIIGNGSEPSKLKAARTIRASKVIVFAEDPASLSSVVESIARLSDRSADVLPPDFCCFLEVQDATTARHMNALMHDQGVPFQWEFFCLAERAGPVIIDRWANLLREQERPDPVVVLGSSEVSRSVVSTVLRHNRGTVSKHRVEVHWILDAEPSLPLTQLEDLTEDGDETNLRLHVVSGNTSEHTATALRSLARAPGLIVVAEPVIPTALHYLTVATIVAQERHTLLVAVAEQPSVLRLLESHQRVAVFDVARELAHDERIAHGRLETLARALHDGYLRQLNRTLEPHEREKKPAYRSWGELPADLRDQNYDAARAARQMLRRHGFDIVHSTPLLPNVSRFDESVVEALACEEHLRWFRARHPGAPEPAWNDVETQHAEQSRDQIRRLPSMMNAADLQITRLTQSETVDHA